MTSDSCSMPVVLLSGCAILKSGKILLIRKKGKDIWELPGGIVQDRQDDELAARDKTKAQIGVEPVIVQQFTVLEYQLDHQNLEATIFECDVDPDASFVPGGNVDSVQWFEIGSLGSESIGEDVRAIIEEL